MFVKPRTSTHPKFTISPHCQPSRVQSACLTQALPYLFTDVTWKIEILTEEDDAGMQLPVFVTDQVHDQTQPSQWQSDTVSTPVTTVAPSQQKRPRRMKSLKVLEYCGQYQHVKLSVSGHGTGPRRSNDLHHVTSLTQHHGPKAATSDGKPSRKRHATAEHQDARVIPSYCQPASSFLELHVKG